MPSNLGAKSTFIFIFILFFPGGFCLDFDMGKGLTEGPLKNNFFLVAPKPP